MVLHLPHTEGCFGVPFNCITKDTAFYTTTSRFVTRLGDFPQERQELWLPEDDLRDSSSWSSPPPVLLRLRPNVYYLIKGCLCLRNGVVPLPVEQTLLHLILFMWIIVATQKGPKNTPGQSAVPTPRRAPINGCSSLTDSTAASQVSLAGWKIASVSFWRMIREL